jgi:hypothetical protein
MARTRKTEKKSPAPAPAPALGKPGDTFIDHFLADWQVHGPTTIQSLRTEKPADYVRIALSLFTKQPEQEADPLRDLSDAELAERIEGIAARIGVDIRPRAPARRAGEVDEDGPADA